MPALIDVATARQHVETDLGDAAVQRLIDDADAAIVDRYGPHAGNVTAELGPTGEYGDNQGPALILDRPATAIVSATEYVFRADAAGVLLNANDFRLLSPHQLERLTTGANPRLAWGERVVLVYAPSDEAARRTFMEIDLVKLAAKYEAVSSERFGDYSATHKDYERERQGILGRLRGRRLPFA